MKSLLSLLILVVSLSAHGRAKVDPALGPFVNGQTGESYTKVLVLMDYLPSESNPQLYDRAAVLEYLKWQSRSAWSYVDNHLRNNEPTVNNNFRPLLLFWLNQSFSGYVTPEGLRMLARTPGVTKIYANHSIEQQQPVSGRMAPPTIPGLEQDLPYNFKLIGMDRIMAEMPQVNGQGVLIASIDTGVDASHPDLAGKIPLFYDSAKGQISDPFDAHYHGTHTIGTMIGTRETGIGIAPAAQLIAAGGLNWEAQVRAMEWMLNPDGNDQTVNDIPRAVNNSWTSRAAPDQEFHYRAISAWEAAGILPVFSAGNSGRQGPRSITPPKEHPATLTVGNLAQGGTINPSSSIGPATYKGQDIQKPEISAPGTDIKSTMPNGEYGELTGTSMAAPHVAGVAALMFQVAPQLTPSDVKSIVIRTANDHGQIGAMDGIGSWNPYYGYGKLNAYAAVKAALSMVQRVAFNMSALIPSSFGMAKESSMDELLEKSRPKLKDVLKMPEDLEGSNWLTVEDL